MLFRIRLLGRDFVLLQISLIGFAFTFLELLLLSVSAIQAPLDHSSALFVLLLFHLLNVV